MRNPDTAHRTSARRPRMENARDASSQAVRHHNVSVSTTIITRLSDTTTFVSVLLL